MFWNKSKMKCPFCGQKVLKKEWETHTATAVGCFAERWRKMLIEQDISNNKEAGNEQLWSFSARLDEFTH